MRKTVHSINAIGTTGHPHAKKKKRKKNTELKAVTKKLKCSRDLYINTKL